MTLDLSVTFVIMQIVNSLFITVIRLTVVTDPRCRLGAIYRPGRGGG